MNITEISEYSRNKTRILVYCSLSSAVKLLIQILEFNNKDFDFFSETISKNSDSDFVILETSYTEKASAFRPNIVLISNEIPAEKIIPVLENIIQGGVLICSSENENIADNTENYFRKLFFGKTQFRKNGSSYVLDTEIGTIPLMTNDENLIENINGIKLLCQQFGIMEEEFYEALMGFE